MNIQQQQKKTPIKIISDRAMNPEPNSYWSLKDEVRALRKHAFISEYQKSYKGKQKNN